jgi:hypothetical protein
MMGERSGNVRDSFMSQMSVMFSTGEKPREETLNSAQEHSCSKKASSGTTGELF